MAGHLRAVLDQPSRRAGTVPGERSCSGIEGPKIEIEKRRQEMTTQMIVSAKEWDAAREKLLVKEKAHTRARDALAAERRQMPWMAVDKAYVFEGPTGRASLLELFEGRRQLIVYRAFFEPGVHGWPEH